MGKIKIKKALTKKQRKKKQDIKNYMLKRVDSLSWEMGEKRYSYRQELYDRKSIFGHKYYCIFI